MGLDRREALRRLAMGGVGTATTVLWGDRLLAHAQAHPANEIARDAGEAWVPKVLTAEQDETVVMLTEMIIPETDTPGAKAAQVNRYIDTLLDDVDDDEREGFLGGLAWMDAQSQERFGAPFRGIASDEQHELLTSISTPSEEATESNPGEEFFSVIKELTVKGYYTSEIGMREELGHDGRLFFVDYPGCEHPEHQNGTTPKAGGSR